MRKQRVFLEFDRQHGVDPQEGLNVIRGAMICAVIVVIISLVSWWAS